MRSALAIVMLLCTAAVVPGCGCQRDKPAVETREITGESKTIAIINRLAEGQALSDWSLVEPAKRYVGEELYDPINGAADKYFPFGFKEAAFAFFEKGDALVEVQIYLMGSPDDAAGIFSLYDDVNHDHTLIAARKKDGIRHSTTTFVVGIASVGDRHLDLAKGPYYMRLLSQGDELERGDLAAFAQKIAENMNEAFSAPAVLDFLPPERVHGSVKYFRLASTQADVFYIADENTFGLSEKTFGVSACYGTRTTEAGTKVGTNALFVIEYPSADAALAAFDSAREFFGKEPYRTFGVTEGPEPQLLIQKGDADFVKLARCHHLLYGAWMIEDTERVNDLFDQLRQRIRQKTAVGRHPAGGE